MQEASSFTGGGNDVGMVLIGGFFAARSREGEKALMQQVPQTQLWLGNAADLRDIPGLLNTGAEAIIDLAIEEPLPTLPRVINYCRFAITDDGEGAEAAITAALQTGAAFINANKILAVCCNAGINRSPTVAAAILALAKSESFESQLRLVSTGKESM